MNLSYINLNCLIKVIQVTEDEYGSLFQLMFLIFLKILNQKNKNKYVEKAGFNRSAMFLRSFLVIRTLRKINKKYVSTESPTNSGK